MSIGDSKEKTFQQGLFVGHGHSNSFDRMIALEPFRRSASGRNKLLTYSPLVWVRRFAWRSVKFPSAVRIHIVLPRSTSRGRSRFLFDLMRIQIMSS